MARRTNIIIISLICFSAIVCAQSHRTKKAKKNKKAVAEKVANQGAQPDILSLQAVVDSLSPEQDSLLVGEDSLSIDSIARDIPYPLRAVIKIDTLLSDPMFERSQVGLMVYDLDGDSVIYAKNHRQLMRPASTMKVITAITALDRLGAHYRYTTNLYYTGECDSTSLYGNLYVHGTMNPTFTDYDLDCFVEGVMKLHVDTIRGCLVADRSFKDDKMLGEGWCWDDKNPVLTPLLFKRGDNLLGSLRSRLEEHGVVVLGNDSIGRVPNGAQLLTDRYAELTSVLYKMMKDSDNLYAESVFYQIGGANNTTATAKNAQAVEKEVLRRAGVDNDSYRLADGSGLSLYNYLTAEAEVLMLRHAYRNKKIFGELCQSMPRAGVDGTLKKRMKKSPVLDNVRAKTGTLIGISSIAGYATAPNGNLLAFCIINQGITSKSKAHNFQDKVCKAICE